MDILDAILLDMMREMRHERRMEEIRSLDVETWAQQVRSEEIERTLFTGCAERRGMPRGYQCDRCGEFVPVREPGSGDYTAPPAIEVRDAGGDEHVVYLCPGCQEQFVGWVDDGVTRGA